MTVGELRARMTHVEFMEWMAELQLRNEDREQAQTQGELADMANAALARVQG